MESAADIESEDHGTRGDRTRRAIIAAARTHFTAQGYEGTTLGEVAASAGVAGPTVAFHFGGKDGLLAAVIDAYYEDLIRRAEVAIDRPSTPMERLVAFARFWLGAIDGDFDLFGVFLGHGAFRDVSSESGRTIRANNVRVTRLFERIVDDLKADGHLRADVPTRLVRDTFFGAAEHLLRGQLHTSRPLDHRRAADRILDLLLRGAAPGPATSADDDRLARMEDKLDALVRGTPPTGT